MHSRILSRAVGALTGGALVLTLAATPAAATTGAHLVKNLNQGRSSSPRELTPFGARLVFTATDSAHGRELWITDGTSAGTRRLADIRPGPKSSGPKHLTVVGGQLLFTATDGVHGRELWRSDGTRQGTSLVKDLTHGSAGSGFSDITAVGGIAYFFKQDHAVELWTSDGTRAGTHFVVDVDPTSPEYPDGITGGFAFGGLFFFSADDHVNGFKLRVSDGTPEGTRIVPGTNDRAGLFTAVGDTLFFTAGEDGFGGDGLELWTTDAAGTAATFVATVNGAYEMVSFRAKAYFTNDFLYKSNGTAAGTKPVGGPAGWSLTPIGRSLFFTGVDDQHGTELWITDGSAAGTHMVKDINTHGSGDLSGSQPSHLVNLDGQLYFTATRQLGGLPSHGKYQVWTSDGTAGGTRQVTTINPAEGAAPADLTVAGGHLFFTANDGVNGRELWVLTP